MAKISEIMLLQQPEQPALAIEVQTSIEYYYSNPDVPEEEHVTRVEMPLL